MAESTQNTRGEWVPAVPLPTMVGLRKRCRCGRSFWTRDDGLSTGMHPGVFELRWTTATPVWAGDNQAWPDSGLVDALEQIIHARLVVGEGVRGAARSVLAALAAAGTEVSR